MTFTEFINENWVVMLLSAMSYWYAYRLLKKHEIERIRPKKAPALPKKKRVPYAEETGKLMLFLGIAFTVDIFLRILFGGVVSLILTIAVFAIFVVLWKRCYDKYER